jgi:hypothetical protein
MPYDWASEASAVFKVLPVNWFLIAAALYLPVVFVAQRLLRHVGPFALNTILMLWNLFLSLSSGYCAYFVWKDLFLPQLQSGTLDGMTCSTQAYLHESVREGNHEMIVSSSLNKPRLDSCCFSISPNRWNGLTHFFCF